jgi:carotenoid cleavage dioxygenase-like enzyme
MGFEDMFNDSFGEVFPGLCTALPKLPRFVEGTLVMQSTYQYSMGGTSVQAWLDAYWKLHTLELKDGMACYKTRRIRTGFYNNSVKHGTVAPGVFFMETNPPRKCLLGGLCNIMGANDNNFAVTYRMQDDNGGYRYALMTDTELHLDFDVESLAVIGKRDFSDHIKAHPTDMLKGGGTHLQCQAGMGDSAHDCSGDLFGVVFESGTVRAGLNLVDLYRLRKGAPNVRELVSSIPVPFAPGSFHSFGLTDDWAILPLQPYSIDSTTLIKGAGIIDSIVLKGNTTNIYLANLHDGTVRTFSFERPIYFVHVVNSWQNRTHVTFDVSAFAKPTFTLDDPAMVLPVLRNKSARDASDNGQTIRRYELDLQSGAVKETFLTDGQSFIDFPKVRTVFFPETLILIVASTNSAESFSLIFHLAPSKSKSSPSSEKAKGSCVSESSRNHRLSRLISLMLPSSS